MDINCIYIQELNFEAMRDFIIRHFGRILAVLGCSTLVTACYGIPYEQYIPVKGKVIDSETSLPVKGMKVTVNVGFDALGSSGVQSLEPTGRQEVVTTGTDGTFFVEVEAYGAVDAVMLDVVDVDGEQNGRYLPETVVAGYDEGETIVVEVESID